MTKLATALPLTGAASLHEGAIVAIIPWDGAKDRQPGYAGAPDDKTFRYLARTYANAHTRMAAQRPREGSPPNKVRPRRSQDSPLLCSRLTDCLTHLTASTVCLFWPGTQRSCCIGNAGSRCRTIRTTPHLAQQAPPEYLPEWQALRAPHSMGLAHVQQLVLEVGEPLRHFRQVYLLDLEILQCTGAISERSPPVRSLVVRLCGTLVRPSPANLPFLSFSVTQLSTFVPASANPQCRRVTAANRGTRSPLKVHRLPALRQHDRYPQRLRQHGRRGALAAPHAPTTSDAPATFDPATCCCQALHIQTRLAPKSPLRLSLR